MEAFVKDVNRARALTVETVMQPPAYRITANNIEEALRQMKQLKQDYAYHVTEEGYQGLVTKESLIDAADTQESAFDEDIYEELPAVSPDAVIEEVLTETMSYEYSLPVVDDDGNLKGELERQAVAEIFAEAKETEAAETDIDIEHKKAG